jgi:hypothetical protein
VQDLRRLTTFELCRVWRANDPTAQATTVAEFVSFARERRRLLDELERRSPAGVAAWLVSNDPAAFDPRRFLAESSPDAPPADPATVDWDELTRGQG